MFTTKNLQQKDMKWVSVFNGSFGKSDMSGVYEAIENLNNPESISLGEYHGKIISVNSLNDEKGIQTWFDISKAKLINYIKVDPNEFESLFVEAKNSQLNSNYDEKKSLLDMQNYTESTNILW